MRFGLLLLGLFLVCVQRGHGLTCYDCTSVDGATANCDVIVAGTTNSVTCTTANALCGTTTVLDSGTTTVTRACTATAVAAATCTGSASAYTCSAATCATDDCNSAAEPAFVLTCHQCTSVAGATTACDTIAGGTEPTACASGETFCSTTTSSDSAGVVTVTRACAATAPSEFCTGISTGVYSCAASCNTVGCNSATAPTFALACHVCDPVGAGTTTTCETIGDDTHLAACTSGEAFCSTTTSSDGSTVTVTRACAATAPSEFCTGLSSGTYSCATSCNTAGCNSATAPAFAFNCYTCTSTDGSTANCDTLDPTTAKAVCASGQSHCLATRQASTSSGVRSVTVTRGCSSAAAVACDTASLTYDSYTCPTSCNNGASCDTGPYEGVALDCNVCASGDSDCDETISVTSLQLACAITDNHCISSRIVAGAGTATFSRACAVNPITAACTGDDADYICSSSCNSADNCNTAAPPTFAFQCYVCTSTDGSDSTCENPTGSTHLTTCASGEAFCSTQRVATTSSNVRSVVLTRACASAASTTCSGTFGAFDCTATCDQVGCNSGFTDAGIALNCIECTSTNRGIAACETISGTTNTAVCDIDANYCSTVETGVTTNSNLDITVTRACAVTSASGCTGNAAGYTCSDSCNSDNCNTAAPSSFTFSCYACNSTDGGNAGCETPSGTVNQMTCPSGSSLCSTTRNDTTVEGVRNVTLSRGCASTAASGDACSGTYGDFDCHTTCDTVNCNTDSPVVPITCYECNSTAGVPSSCHTPSGTTNQVTCPATSTHCFTETVGTAANYSAVSVMRGCTSTAASNSCNGTSYPNFTCSYTCTTGNCNNDLPLHTIVIVGKAPSQQASVMMLFGSMVLSVFAKWIF